MLVTTMTSGGRSERKKERKETQNIPQNFRKSRFLGIKTHFPLLTFFEEIPGCIVFEPFYFSYFIFPFSN